MESTLPPENIVAIDGKVLSAKKLASIKRMAAHGVTLDAIAKSQKLSPDQLQQSLGVEIAQRYLDSNLQVLDALHRMAVSGRNPSATIFWINSHCGELLGVSCESGKGVSSANDKLTPSDSPSPDSPKKSGSSTFQKPKFGRVVFHVYNNEGEPNVEC